MKIGDTVYFMHWNKIKSGVIKNIFKERINLKVDFLIHENLTLNESEIFASIDLLIENLRNER